MRLGDAYGGEIRCRRDGWVWLCEGRGWRLICVFLAVRRLGDSGLGFELLMDPVVLAGVAVDCLMMSAGWGFLYVGFF